MTSLTQQMEQLQEQQRILAEKIKEVETRKHKEYIMKKCPVCPAEVEDNAPFCNMCGSNMCDQRMSHRTSLP